MDLISILIICIFATSLICGISFGLYRRLKRSIIRLILVVISLIASYIIAFKCTDLILASKVFGLLKGQTVYEYLINMLPSSQAAYASLIKPVLNIIVSVVAFGIIFYIFKLITLLLHGVLCIFFKKDHKFFALFGMIIGTIQGALIGIILIIPLMTVTKVLTVVNDEAIVDTFNLPPVVSKLAKEADSFEEGKVYEILETFKIVQIEETLEKYTDDNVNTTLDSELKVIKLGISLKNKADKFFTKYDSEGFTEAVKDDFVNLINELNQSVNSLSQQEAKRFEDLIKVTLNVEVNLSEVDFNKEIIAINSLYEIKSTSNPLLFDQVIDNLGNTKLILKVLVSTNTTVYDAKTIIGEVVFNEKINNTSFDAQTKSDLRKIFGIEG